MWYSGSAKEACEPPSSSGKERNGRPSDGRRRLELPEHVPDPIQPAFDGLRSLLAPDGVALITVPYQLNAPTVEHFETLHEWCICTLGDRRLLVNRTPQGRYEVFDRLNFHGGSSGVTLEMRVFGKDDLENRLLCSGFYFKVMEEEYPDFGIFWPRRYSLPIVAGKSIARLAGLESKPLRQ